MYELLLISVVVAAGYWGQFFIRRRPHGTITFGVMNVAAALLSLLGVWSHHGGPEAFGVVGGIGLGMGTCLLVVGPMVRSLARRLAGKGYLEVSKRVFDVAELLNPGSGISEEKALLGAMQEIRDGKVDQTIEALSQARGRAPADARRAIDERITMLYLAAYRWEDAIAHAEAELLDLPPLIPLTDEPPTLRDALGIAPPVWVELLGAYGRIGNLDRAATMLERLETACVDRADSGVWIHRARMMFLALAGRPTSVRELVAPKKARHMSTAARAYWIAVAHEHHGDRDAATSAYAKARAQSRGKPREMIDRAVANLDKAKPTELSESATVAVARVEAAPIPETPAVDRPSAIWASPMLVGVIAATALTIAIFVGSTTDVGVLARVGAIVRGYVAAGEWWRIVAAIFIHIGGIHLVVNSLGLWFIGRLAEEMFGGARTIALFAISGLVGATASFLASPAGVSAGASGAIFGLLGAVFAELVIHRKHYRTAWKRGMMGSLAIVTIAQIAIDFMYPIVDQWAHGGGLLSGALAGALLSSKTRWARFSLYAARAIAISFGLAVVFAIVMVARTTVADSAAREPRVPRAVGAVIVSAPASWIVTADGIADADEIYEVNITTASTSDLALATWIGMAPSNAQQHSYALEQTVPAEQRAVALPAGWEGTEMIVSFVDAMDYRQYQRMIVCGKSFGATTVLVRIYAPDSIVKAAPEYIAQLLASIHDGTPVFPMGPTGP